MEAETPRRKQTTNRNRMREKLGHCALPPGCHRKPCSGVLDGFPDVQTSRKKAAQVFHPLLLIYPSSLWPLITNKKKDDKKLPNVFLCGFTQMVSFSTIIWSLFSQIPLMSVYHKCQEELWAISKSNPDNIWLPCSWREKTDGLMLPTGKKIKLSRKGEREYQYVTQKPTATDTRNQEPFLMNHLKDLHLICW